MVMNGYYLPRSGAIQLILNAGWFESHGKTGTSHGTWNPYDTHIPLIFMGWGVHPGHTNEPVYMTDIAPTIAALPAYPDAQWLRGEAHHGRIALTLHPGGSGD